MVTWTCLPSSAGQRSFTWNTTSANTPGTKVIEFDFHDAVVFVRKTQDEDRSRCRLCRLSATDSTCPLAVPQRSPLLPMGILG